MKITEKEPEPQKRLDSFGDGLIIKPFDWRAYNYSQTREKTIFLRLLDDLCNLLDDERYHGDGRKAASLSHQVFCVCLKVYLNASSRGLISDLELCRKKEHLMVVPHFNSILNYFNNKEVRKALNYLIQLSALPLAQLEKTFAIDSSGFSEHRYMEKWSDIRQKHHLHRQYRKAHCIYGVYSNVVASCIVTEGTAGDSPKFKQLLKDAAANFNIEEITADMAYSSRENLKYADQLGITPFVPFKKNAKGNSKGAIVWNRMYKYFKENPKEFAKHYHQRSNAESGFFMIKQKFGEFVKSKTELAQTNEILAKVLCHNLRTLIQEIYLSDLDIDFISCAKPVLQALHKNYFISKS